MPTPPGLDGDNMENEMNIKDLATAVLCCAVFAFWGVLLALGV